MPGALATQRSRMSYAVSTLARVMAILGGLALTALVLLVCVSILGRSLSGLAHSSWMADLAPGLADALLATGLGPVPGDYEIVEAGMAFAIFAFLPLCQMQRAHATVDIFTSVLSANTNRWLQAFWELCLTAAILLITWRLGAGTLDKIETGEITFLLGFPKWWAYAASLGAALVASVVAVFCAVARCQDALNPDASGARRRPS